MAICSLPGHHNEAGRQARQQQAHARQVASSSLASGTAGRLALLAACVFGPPAHLVRFFSQLKLGEQL